VIDRIEDATLAVSRLVASVEEVSVRAVSVGVVSIEEVSTAEMSILDGSTAEGAELSMEEFKAVDVPTGVCTDVLSVDASK
jgi:hypothetical protein